MALTGNGGDVRDNKFGEAAVGQPAIAGSQPWRELRRIADVMGLHDVFDVRGKTVHFLVENGVQTDRRPGGSIFYGC